MKTIEVDSTEAKIISWGITVLILVALVCLIIVTIYLAMFGVAQLRAHWPAS